MATTARSSCCRALRILSNANRPRLLPLRPSSSLPSSSSSSSPLRSYITRLTPSRVFSRPFASPSGGSSSNVIAVKTDTEFLSARTLAQENGGVAIVYFTAKWCGPCRMISPLVDELSTKHEKATFLKVDIDEEGLTDIVSEAKVTSVPTFKFYRGGKPLGDLVGANSTELKAKIAALCEK